MKSTIVTKKVTGGMGAGLDATYANRTPSDLGNLTEGAISLGRSSNNKYVKYTSATAIFDSDLVDGETVHFVQKNKDGTIFVSPKIDPQNLKWSKTAHVSYNQKVIDLGYSATNSSKNWGFPSTIADHVGEYVVIRIYDMDSPMTTGLQNGVKSVHYQVKEGDTEADVHTAVHTELQKYEGVMYSAVTKQDNAGLYGYTFTGLSGKNFKVVPEQLVYDGAVTVNTDIKIPIGEGDQILELEKEGAVDGRGYNPSEGVHSGAYTSQFMADPTVDYDVYVLRWYIPRSQQISEGGKMEQRMVIATPVNASSATAQKISDQVEDVLEALADQTKVWDT